MNKKAKLVLGEKQLGMLLVLPALIIITVIAVWPVLRSFWISLYDIRLNDPAKAEMHNAYQIDMEKYVGTFPVLINVVDKEQKNAEGAAKQKLTDMSGKLHKLEDGLKQNTSFAQAYDQVDRLLFDFQPVPSALKYAKMDDATVKLYSGTLQDVQQLSQDLKKGDLVKKPDDIIGLVQNLQTSFIQPNFVGLDNYKRYLSDKRMWNSLANTSIFTVFSVFTELVLGLAVAMLINKAFKGRGLIRTAVLIPWATPTAISGMIWMYLYDGQNGVVARLFTKAGLVSDPSVLLSTKAGALFSVIFADVWKTTPFMALLLLAGLQTINGSLYEAAEVDGATKRQQFFAVTLPLLKSTILVSLLFRTLDAFRVFDLIYVLTGGGPANATESISIYAYKTMFAQLNFGGGSALSVIVFLCIAIISIAFIKILGADIMSGRGVK